jgi:methyl-accepting chemotaxis protein
MANMLKTFFHGSRLAFALSLMAAWGAIVWLAGLAVSAARQGAGGGWAIAVAVVGCLAVAACAVIAMRAGARPLRIAAEGAKRVAAGNVAEPIAPSQDGADELLKALEEMREQTFKIVNDVRTRTLAIATSSGHIGADQAAFASMVRTQADALDSTASSLEELTAAVEHSAAHSARAHQMASSALTLASEGGSAVQQVVHTMGTIRTSSNKIVDIIGVIDGIAFQTNILALNAAVEAARAGEEGRGFAVVASEVRSLATRSAEAAKAVKALIEESVQAVEAGAGLVERAGDTMHQVVGSVTQVAETITELSASARQQSAGIGEINRAITEIDEATKRYASVIERAAEPVKALHEQASGLTDAVSFFKLGEREFASMDDAVALVHRAAQHLKSHGREAFLAEVHKLDKSQFIDRDLYLSIYDMNVQCVAHGVNARLVGIDGRNFKDMDGEAFVSEIVTQAKTKGSGTITYKWLNPLTQKAMLKSTYFERQGDLVLSCGAYAALDA